MLSALSGCTIAQWCCKLNSNVSMLNSHNNMLKPFLAGTTEQNHKCKLHSSAGREVRGSPKIQGDHKCLY